MLAGKFEEMGNLSQATLTLSPAVQSSGLGNGSYHKLSMLPSPRFAMGDGDASGELSGALIK
jgi:hypothetical protein